MLLSYTISNSIRQAEASASVSSWRQHGTAQAKTKRRAA
jgi:hypothetical protein